MYKKLLKISLSTTILLLIFYNIDLNEFILNLSQISTFAVFGALFFIIIQTFFVSFRWKMIIEKCCKNIAYIDVVKMHYLSLGISLFLPNIVAEPSLKSMLMKSHGISITNSLITVVLDKAFVVIGLLLMTLIALPILYFLYGADEKLVVTYLSILTVILIVYLQNKFSGFSLINRFMEYVTIKFPAISNTVKYLNYDEVLIIKCLGITFLSQLSAIFAFYILCLFMPIEITYIECLLLLIPAFLITTIPIAFNGWGVREVSVIYMLSLIDVPTEIAFAVSVQFGLIGLLVWSIGLISWVRFKT